VFYENLITLFDIVFDADLLAGGGGKSADFTYLGWRQLIRITRNI
jgi:hypothetical protein